MRSLRDWSSDVCSSDLVASGGVHHDRAGLATGASGWRWDECACGGFGVTSPSLIHDVMGVSMDRYNRWNRQDGATAIAALEQALEAAGLPNQLEAPTRFLARAEALTEKAREAKLAAGSRLEVANRNLYDGLVDLDEYGSVIAEVGVWLDDEGPAMRGAMQAA